MAIVGSSLLALFFAMLARGIAEPQVPAIYVFGDSTADVGNNNYLPGTDGKANFPHNGIDFPHSRPTGRFSNGYNAIDFVASHMGFRRSPPPFLSLTNKTNHLILRGLRGVSFASGGSGILNSTGSTITMTKQIQDFTKLHSNIITRMGADATNRLLAKSVFLISSGANDVFAFFTENNSPNNTEKERFIASITSDYWDHLKALYNLGARKFAIADVPNVGCCPYSRSLHPSGSCIDVLNDLALSTNKANKALLKNLRLTLQGMNYSVGSFFAVVSNILADPQALGYKEVKNACCGGGEFNAASGCTPNATYCEERSRYLFWDRLHPTHATSKIVGLAFYSGSLKFASPINFKQLVEGDS